MLDTTVPILQWSITSLLLLCLLVVSHFEKAIFLASKMRRACVCDGDDYDIFFILNFETTHLFVLLPS